MLRTALLTTLLFACGGPVGTPLPDTGDTDDTATDDTADTAVEIPNETASIGLFQDCAQALASEMDLAPGTYSGTLDDWTSALDGTCVAGGGAGPDKLFRIEVPPEFELELAYRTVGNDARLYIVDNCNVSSSCLASMNAAGGNAWETLTWSNNTGITKSVFVVLDNRDAVTSGVTWDLEVSLDQYVPPELLDVANTCANFDDLDPIDEDGTFEVAMDGFSNTWTTLGASCSGYSGSSSGVDAATAVYLAEGDTVTAVWSHSFCDPVLFLKEDCGDMSTCLVAADNTYTGGAETITYTNTTGRPHVFVLGLDMWSSSCVPSAANPGTLTLTFDSGVPVGGDTCADAETLTPLGSGNHFVYLDEAGDDLDLGGDGCTGAATPGDDVFVPIAVADGQELSATFRTEVGEGAVYLLEDCDDAATCIEGIDDSELLRVKWVNDTGADTVVYAVVDSRHAPDTADAPTSGVLSISLRTPVGEIPVANTCAELDAIPLVEAGTHPIVFEDHTNDMAPPSSNICAGTNSWPAAGAGVDGFVRARIRPRETLNVSYSASCHVQLYLYETCGDTSTCLDSEDNGNPERVSYTNNSSNTKDVVISMDGYNTTCAPTFTSPGTLIVERVPPPSAGGDTCADAETKPAIGTGLYFLDFEDATPTLNPSTDGSCDNDISAPGAEMIVPIAVGAYHTVDLLFEARTGDPIVYLVEDCDEVGTCLVGVDEGNPGALSWYNDGPATQIFAVIDDAEPPTSNKALDDGYLQIAVRRPVWEYDAANDCTEASGLDAITHGLWQIELGGHVNSLDLDDGADPSCTGDKTPGVDGFIKVEVEAGQRLTATWDASISTSPVTNGALYLLENCGEADSCLVGADDGDPEQISWLNTTGSAVTLWLVVDSWHGSGPNRGLLDVALTTN